MGRVDILGGRVGLSNSDLDPLCFESDVLAANNLDRDTNCSKCGTQIVYETSRFCSMCGVAKFGNKNEYVKADAEPCAIIFKTYTK